VTSPIVAIPSSTHHRNDAAGEQPHPGEAESQLSLAVELGNIALWRHDLRTGRICHNARGWQMMGMAARPEGLTLAESRALLHQDDLPQVLETVHRSLNEDHPVDLEVRVRHSDGSWRNIMTRRSVERDASGQPVAFIGVSLDVTERVGDERRANEISRRFSLLTGAAGIGYWQFEGDSVRPFWSEPLRVLHGLLPHERAPTFGEWLRHWVHPGDRADISRQFAAWRASDRDDLSVALRLKRRDGAVRHVMAHARAGSQPRRGLQYGLVIDLTERRAAELALRGATERAALAANGVGLGTWELDLDTDQALWDSQMWRLRGRTPQGAAMSEPERLACVHPDDRDKTVQRIHAAEDQRAVLEHEFRVVWPDGQVRWLASRSVERVDPETGARRRYGVNWDITDLRTAAQAHQEREIARRESQAKSQFLARMSHELRTPLNAVLGFAQLMAEKETAADPASSERLQHLEHIRAAGKHLLTLINDALDLSALQTGELRIELQPVALAPLVAQTLPMIGPLAPAGDATPPIRLHIGDLDHHVLADAVRLRQILINLLNNAVKYNRQGGEVRIEASQRGERVVLRVSDTGLGMDDEQLGHLFEPFNRLGFEPRGAFGHVAIEGTGIGLSIVKALVEGMGGTIQVESALGLGTAFEVHLQAAGVSAGVASAAPVEASLAPLAAQDAAPAPDPARGRRQLLYIEDNPVNALIVGELLARRTDVTLHVAVDGTSGLAQAMAQRPALILLDMQLPDFDGFEVLRRLKADPVTASIPCIAVSANAMPQDIERALQAGVADYWTKPLDLQAFMAALDRMFK
jgi:PAS domain S-box-containing protein